MTEGGRQVKKQTKINKVSMLKIYTYILLIYKLKRLYIYIYIYILAGN